MVQISERGPLPVGAGDSVRSSGATRTIAAVLLCGGAGIVVARWWTGTGYVPAPDGLPDPGRLTAIALPVTHLASDISGMVVVGLLMVRWLSPPPLSPPGHEGLAAMAVRWSWWWAAATLVWMTFTMSDMTGRTVTQLPASPDLVLVVFGTQRILAQVVTLWVAVALALYAGRWTSRPALALATSVSVLALLPSALTGHAGHHNETGLTVFALAVHVVAAAVWVGGLLVIVLYLRTEPLRLRAVLPRFSTTALYCATAVAVSGVIVSMVMLGSWSALMDTNRGHLILAKAGALVLLVMIGYWHRRSTVDRAARGDLLPLLRLAGIEVMLMGATVGVAVALSTSA